MEANDFDIKRTMQFIMKQIRGTEETTVYVPPSNPTPPNSASSSYNEKFIKQATEPPVKKNGTVPTKKVLILNEAEYS